MRPETPKARVPKLLTTHQLCQISYRLIEPQSRQEEEGRFCQNMRQFLFIGRKITELNITLWVCCGQGSNPMHNIYAFSIQT